MSSRMRRAILRAALVTITVVGCALASPPSGPAPTLSPAATSAQQIAPRATTPTPPAATPTPPVERSAVPPAVPAPQPTVPPAAGPSVTASPPPPPTEPVAVRIVAAPESSDRALVWATWVLVIANAGLCWITFRGARRQSRDMGASIDVAQRAAEAANRSADAAHRSADSASQSAQLAARQRRDALERETNVTAHRVIQTADRVKQVAVSLIVAYRELSATAGRGANPAMMNPVQQRADKRCEFAKEKADAAQAVLDADFAGKPDEALAAELRRLDESLVQLEATKEEIAAEQAAVKDNIRTAREAMQSSGGRIPPPLL
jgi:hypothetical protein